MGPPSKGNGDTAENEGVSSDLRNREIRIPWRGASRAASEDRVVHVCGPR